MSYYPRICLTTIADLKNIKPAHVYAPLWCPPNQHLSTAPYTRFQVIPHYTGASLDQHNHIPLSLLARNLDTLGLLFLGVEYRLAEGRWAVVYLVILTFSPLVENKRALVFMTPSMEFAVTPLERTNLVGIAGWKVVADWTRVLGRPSITLQGKFVADKGRVLPTPKFPVGASSTNTSTCNS